MSPHRVLVVDDDPEVLEVLVIRLESLGLEVHAHGDPIAAERHLGESGFDVALFDLRMEPIDGLTLMRRTKVLQPHLPILIMTAHGTIDSAVEAIRQGAFDYLTKPFVPEELKGKLGRALAERRWARDRALLGRLGTTLASGGSVDGVLDAVVRATVDATETGRAAVFLEQDGQLVLRASAGTAVASDDELRVVAERAMRRGEPAVETGPTPRAVLAAPLRVDGTLRGVLVAESPGAVVPTTDDLDLLTLFASHATAALKSSHELQRARSGALAALGRVATQVAHELNNPLGGLKVFAHLIEKRLAGHRDDHGVDLARKVDRAVDRLAGIVADIKAYGRPPELQRTPTDPNLVVQECLGLVQDRVTERGVRVVCALEHSLPSFLLDGPELHKALLNLLVNALDAMADGGTLTVRTGRTPDGTLQISVQDTGAGMDEATLGRAFELFFTTKAEGTGLGMAIVRSVVDRHGGRLAVSSQPGAGTCIELLLPAAQVA